MKLPDGQAVHSHSPCSDSVVTLVTVNESAVLSPGKGVITNTAQESNSSSSSREWSPKFRHIVRVTRLKPYTRGRNDSSLAKGSSSLRDPDVARRRKYEAIIY